MDKSTAMLIATIIGGCISSATAYLVATQALKNKLKEMSIERIFSAIEKIELFVIRLRSGAEPDQDEINQFIQNCTCLPENISDMGLALAKEYMNDNSIEKATEFHKKLAEYKRTYIQF